MTNHTETTATEYPTYIGRDEYAGPHSCHRNQAPGLRVVNVKASRVAAYASEGVIWESFGQLRNGREGFARRRYVATPDGGLKLYTADGNILLGHPAERVIRILTK
jgi:hypothetical protein